MDNLVDYVGGTNSVESERNPFQRGRERLRAEVRKLQFGRLEKRDGVKGFTDLSRLECSDGYEMDTLKGYL